MFPDNILFLSLVDCMRRVINNRMLFSDLSTFLFSLQSRIKKIMQADEDIGKIAQGMPLLVCEYKIQHMLICQILTVTFSCFSIFTRVI